MAEQGVERRAPESSKVKPRRAQVEKEGRDGANPNMVPKPLHFLSFPFLSFLFFSFLSSSGLLHTLFILSFGVHLGMSTGIKWVLT